jgi:signal transduction histidine kinase
MYTRTDGSHSRIPVGKFKIGLIAQERLPHLSNNVIEDPRIHDKEWVKEKGIVAFAGYPLIIEDRLVGVMAMFARKPLTENTIAALASIADMIAQGIERKKAEQELQQANRHLKELAVLKADFTAMVAHELDTPLAVIRGYSEMLAASELEPAERSRALDKIQAETEVLGALVDDVRAAATVEREDFAIEPQSVPVRTLLDDAAQIVAALPGNHPLVVENTANKRVWADPNRVGQVLRNLLSNAAKHSPENSPIELRAMPGAMPRRVRIEVVDHGFGIHPDDVKRVFEKFGRARDRYGRKVAGVGLGLYLSRRIMQAHGSDLTLNSGSEDGSVFSFELETCGE